MQLDRMDLRILDELQRDGALSNVELARRVGLLPSPCPVTGARNEVYNVALGDRTMLNPSFTRSNTTWQPMVWPTAPMRSIAISTPATCATAKQC
jgi:hypothetical protein